MKRLHLSFSSEILRAVYETTSIRECCELFSDSPDPGRAADDMRLGYYTQPQIAALLRNRMSCYNQQQLNGYVSTFFDSLKDHPLQEGSGMVDFFSILFHFAEQMVVRCEEQFCYQYEYSDIWLNTVRKIGEELIVTASMVIDDLKSGSSGKRYPDWSYCINHNNYDLKVMLARDRGVSENHFHLRSSAQFFEISWIYLMNHVTSGENAKAIRMIQAHRLDPHSVQPGDDDLETIWKKAAMLRLMLYYLLIHPEYDNEFWSGVLNELYSGDVKEDDETEQTSASDAPEHLRDGQNEAEHRRQPSYFQRAFYRVVQYDNVISLQHLLRIDAMAKSGIDYAKDDEDQNGREWYFNDGERKLIYEALKTVYTKSENSETIREMLFLYSLMKYRFYKEMVQTNDLGGFYNFDQFQSRKSLFIPWRNECNVATETIYHELKDLNFYSFELRIYPEKTPEGIANSIRLYDRAVRAAIEQLRNEERDYTPDVCFFTMHFIKYYDEKKETEPGQCRNWYIRRDVYQQANALLHLDGRIAERIRGIDAAGSEMQVRPEVFAPEYRHLMHYSHRDTDNKQIQPYRGTYHVGEDNYDLLDGLRAISEALMFLDLRAGSRLGHATAIGCNPQIYYQNRNPVSLPRQIFLDNIVWVYFFVRKYNVAVVDSAQLFDYIHRKFNEYFQSIYGVKFGRGHEECFDLRIESLPSEFKEYLYEDYCQTQYDIETYLKAYLLRGDDPDLYVPFYSLDSVVLPHSDQYRICNTMEEMQQARNSVRAKYLYYLYHYDPEIRERGNVFQKEKLPECFLNCLAPIQNALRKQISQAGISIETNPSSNLMIAHLSSYADHPITMFYDYGLSRECGDIQLNVSVNTDNKSVFTTTLSNEYAYLMYYLEKQETGQERPVYSRMSILNWLDQIRRMGNEQSFRNPINGCG